MTIFSNSDDAPVSQAFGGLVPVRLALDARVRYKSVAALNKVLAHTMALRDLYKKAHWQTSGMTFYALHLLFDKHHTEQMQLLDALAARVQTLGGVAIALAHDVATETLIARAPRGREAPAHQLERLLDAHECVLSDTRPLARLAATDGDDGTNDLFVGQVIRTNELQCWIIAEHVLAHTSGST